MQTRQPAVRAESMRREERIDGWTYAYTSNASAIREGQYATVSAMRFRPRITDIRVHITPDDDAWSEETLPVADFIARIKATLAEAIVGAL